MRRKVQVFLLISLIILGIIPSVQLTANSSMKEIKIGDYVRFGAYNNKSIIWKVINVNEEGNPLLFSEAILTIKAFDSRGDYHTDLDRRDYGSNFWPDSNLCQWLNSAESNIKWIQNAPSEENVHNGNNYSLEKGFLAEGNFTQNERNIIKPSNIKVLLSKLDRDLRAGGNQYHILSKDISVNTNYDESYYMNVTNKVFLLSIKELKEYVSDRGWVYTAKPTLPAIGNSDYEYSNYEYIKYWLRTPDSMGKHTVLSVYPEGAISMEGAFVGHEGVRPALYLDTSSLLIKAGEGNISNPYTLTVDEPSSWAVADIEKAIEYNLVTEKVLRSYQRNITREEFCELIVRLYEAFTNKKAELPSTNKFIDTANPEVLKANQLGIVNGVKENIFEPNTNITREQIAVMFYRTIKVLNENLIDGIYPISFSDKNEISNWAAEAIGLMYNKGIISGVGNNMLDPRGNTTREQALVLVKRMYEEFNKSSLETN